jgi:hypothetical protein
VHEDDPVTRTPATPPGSPESSIRAAEEPGPGVARHEQSAPAGSQDQTGAGPVTDAADGVASKWRKTLGPVLRRFRIPLVLLLVGVATGFWAYALLPKRTTIMNPTPLGLFITKNFSFSNIDVTISPSGAQSTNVAVSVSEPMPGGGTAIGRGSLTWAIPRQFAVSGSSNNMNCSGGAEGGTEVGMTFVATSYGGVTPDQEAFTIKDPQISATSNGESAIVELPNVTGLNEANVESSASPAQLTVTYYVPNANTYDWSTPPLTPSGAGNYVSFPQQLSATFSAQASEITGTDHQAQTHDELYTFIAGILLGVAGSAGIAALTEGLHIRYDSRPPSPSLPSIST